MLIPRKFSHRMNCFPKPGLKKSVLVLKVLPEKQPLTDFGLMQMKFHCAEGELSTEQDSEPRVRWEARPA